MKTSPDDVFESLANAFLLQHPEIAHEWRKVKGRWWADGIDLVCAPGTPNEVFASLKGGQIVVGDRVDRDDFEDFGRSVSAEEVAQEAFNDFIELLRRHGYLGAAA